VVGKVSVPNPVVNIKIALRFVNLVVVSAVIFAVFGDVYHAFVSAVKSGVKASFLRFGAAFYLYFS
jgi:hypothetical protein